MSKTLTFHSVTKGDSGINIQYPILMKSQSGSLVILMTKCREGVVIVGNSLYSPGQQSDVWDQPSMRPFEGEIILSNKTIQS